MRVNIKTLASESGVSVATVSRALRGLGGMSEETRQHVKTVAARLGYVRDPLLASALTFARKPDKPVYRETLAFLAVRPPRDAEPRPWMAGFWRGVMERAAELGYQVERFQLPKDLRAQRTVARQLLARGIRGVVFGPRVWTDSRQLADEWTRFAAIEIEHTLETSSFPRIDRLLADDMERLLDELYARGYRRIGLAMQGADEDRRHWAVFAACLLFERQHRDAVRVTSLFEDTEDYSPASVDRWAKKRRPEVIIGNGPEPLDWLQAAGWRVPSDIGVCRIDCVEGRPESGLKINYEDMGRMAVSQLASALERHDSHYESPQPVVCIRSEWHEGTTLRQ
ncbi:LacI family transcriptional regulator [Opitutaceae bacterium TAV4]|nr:LacI family transcriptional regulator [Opitutaceae bacterium TAV4]RRK02245.1 LacI family transcriptional regulator [Opitutaceae bacterium TAV3]